LIKSLENTFLINHPKCLDSENNLLKSISLVSTSSPSASLFMIRYFLLSSYSFLKSLFISTRNSSHHALAQLCIALVRLGVDGFTSASSEIMLPMTLLKKFDDSRINSSFLAFLLVLFRFSNLNFPQLKDSELEYVFNTSVNPSFCIRRVAVLEAKVLCVFTVGLI
jgi:hypothetical protein